MKPILIRATFALLLFFPALSFAQQSPLYSQYMLNDYVINPAIAGSKSYFPVRLSVRDQWTGFEEAPSTQSLSFHRHVGDGRVGLGGIMYQDNTGPTSQMGFQVTYAYHAYLSSIESNLSLGVSPMVYQYTLNTQDLTFHNPEIVGGGTYREILPDASVGAYLYGRGYSIGVSVYQLFESMFKESVYQAYGDNTGARHYFLTAAITKEIHKSFHVEPSVMLKAIDVGPTQLDLNVRAIFNRKFWTGLSLRTDQSVVVLLGMNLETFHLAYGFDYTMQSIGTHTSGSHEISVGFNIQDPNSRRHVYYWRY